MEVRSYNFLLQTGERTLGAKLIYSHPIHTRPGIVLLHGGGKTPGKETLARLQSKLALKYTTLSFDFAGVGESAHHNWEDNTLEKRLKDAQAALDLLIDITQGAPVGGIGISMGGHILSRLTLDNHQLKCLMLMAPAAYGQETENKRFNQEFTQVLRTPNSWTNSLAFEALQRFSGPRTIIYGEEEEIIPYEIQQRYQSLCKKPNKFHLIPRVGHFFYEGAGEIKRQATDLVDNIALNFFNENLPVCYRILHETAEEAKIS